MFLERSMSSLRWSYNNNQNNAISDNTQTETTELGGP